MKIFIAKYRGACLGIQEYAFEPIQRLTELKKRFPWLHFFCYPPAHNRNVVRMAEMAGISLVKSIADIPPEFYGQAMYIQSAHGGSSSNRSLAGQRGIIFGDMTCPLVVRNHRLIASYIKRGDDRLAVVIGHAGHQEMIGCLEPEAISSLQQRQIILLDPRSKPMLSGEDIRRVRSAAEVVVVTQTTLAKSETEEAVAFLKPLLPKRFIDGIGRCGATTSRQEALIDLIDRCGVDTVLVVGDIQFFKSSNTTRLVEITQQRGVKTRCTIDTDSVDPSWFVDTKILGITAGASVLPKDFDAVIELVQSLTSGELVQHEFSATTEQMSTKARDAEFERIEFELEQRVLAHSKK